MPKHITIFEYGEIVPIVVTAEDLLYSSDLRSRSDCPLARAIKRTLFIRDIELSWDFVEEPGTKARFFVIPPSWNIGNIQNYVAEASRDSSFTTTVRLIARDNVGIIKSSDNPHTPSTIKIFPQNI